MKHNRIGRRLLRTLSVALCAALLLAQTAFAADGSALTLHYDQDDVAFQVYRVAEVTFDGYQLTGQFADYQVALPGDGWREAAAALAAYAASDALTADQTGVTADGQVTFSGLEDGLYLVVGESAVTDGWRYTPAPFLVLIDGDDVISQVKYDMEEEPDTTVYEDYTVEKVWVDDTEGDRPEAVVIELLCDGEVYDAVTLTAADGWSHTWTGLDASHTWQVSEADVAEGYTVSVSREGNLFTVTNTVVAEENPDDGGTDDSQTPDDGDGSSTDDTGDTGTGDTGNTGTDDTGDTTTDSSSAQTGDESLLLPAVAGMAAAMLAVAILMRQRRRTED